MSPGNKLWEIVKSEFAWRFPNQSRHNPDWVIMDEKEKAAWEKVAEYFVQSLEVVGSVREAKTIFTVK